MSKERENFVKIAMAIIKKDYPFRPQRLAIASKMYSKWVQRKSTKKVFPLPGSPTRTKAISPDDPPWAASLT